MVKEFFDPFNVGVGEKKFGYVSVLDTVAISFDMPVGVVKGVESGPTLAITGGLYPTEYAGVEAASRLYQDVQPKDLKGTLIVIPVMNMPVFQFRTPWLNLRSSITPFDGGAINSMFPGSPTGRPTQVLCNKVMEILTKADYHVDYRGGDLPESHLVHTIYPRIGKEIDATCETMAKVFGLEYVLPGTPEISHTGKGAMIYELVTRGVASIISESGLGYNTMPSEEEIQPHITGTKNLMKYFGMIEGEIVKPKAQRFLDMKWNRVPAIKPGLFTAIADQGHILSKDQIIGRITNLDGSLVEEIKSPIEGVVHTMYPRKVVYPGDTLYMILKIDALTGW